MFATPRAVACLEFTLVENLNGDNRDSFTLLVCGEKEAMGMDSSEWSWQRLNIEALVPIRVQGLPNDAGGTGFVYVHCNDSKWTWKAKGFTVG